MPEVSSRAAYGSSHHASTRFRNRTCIDRQCLPDHTLHEHLRDLLLLEPSHGRLGEASLPAFDWLITSSTTPRSEQRMHRSSCRHELKIRNMKARTMTRDEEEVRRELVEVAVLDLRDAWSGDAKRLGRVGLCIEYRDVANPGAPIPKACLKSPLRGAASPESTAGSVFRPWSA